MRLLTRLVAKPGTGFPTPLGGLLLVAGLFSGRMFDEFTGRRGPPTPTDRIVHVIFGAGMVGIRILSGVVGHRTAKPKPIDPELD